MANLWQSFLVFLIVYCANIFASECGYKRISQGWYPVANGYQYTVLQEYESWSSVRAKCQALGADLAAVGMRDFEIRSNVIKGLGFTAEHLWIGLNDLAKEGQWYWIDGVEATSSNVFWSAGEPNNDHDEDCGVILPSNLYTNDGKCGSGFYGLCEKRLEVSDCFCDLANQCQINQLDQLQQEIKELRSQYNKNNKDIIDISDEIAALRVEMKQKE